MTIFILSHAGPVYGFRAVKFSVPFARCRTNWALIWLYIRLENNTLSSNENLNYQVWSLVVTFSFYLIFWHNCAMRLNESSKPPMDKFHEISGAPGLSQSVKVKLCAVSSARSLIGQCHQKEGKLKRKWTADVLLTSATYLNYFMLNFIEVFPKHHKIEIYILIKYNFLLNSQDVIFLFSRRKIQIESKTIKNYWFDL